MEPVDAYLQIGQEYEEDIEEGSGQDPEVLVEEGHLHSLQCEQGNNHLQCMQNSISSKVINLFCNSFSETDERFK